jgi:hypothetical protein
MERLNARLKVWRCLADRWRHSIHKHGRAFRAVVRLVNLDLFAHPLWEKHRAV